MATFTYYNIIQNFYIYIAKPKIQSEIEYFYATKLPEQNKNHSKSKTKQISGTNIPRTSKFVNKLHNSKQKHTAHRRIRSPSNNEIRNKKHTYIKSTQTKGKLTTISKKKYCTLTGVKSFDVANMRELKTFPEIQTKQQMHKNKILTAIKLDLTPVKQALTAVKHRVSHVTRQKTNRDSSTPKKHKSRITLT